MVEQVEEQWVGVSDGRQAWASAAGEVLVEVAGSYPRVITQGDLAEQVQARTGLRTRSPWRSWIGGVLAIVVTQARAAGLPPLTSLVAHRADGGEPDEGTIRARLLCYRRFADDVPAEVIAEAEDRAIAERLAKEEAARAKPARAPRVRTTTPRATKPKAAPKVEEAPAICPTCFMQLPLNGICDNCG